MVHITGTERDFPMKMNKIIAMTAFIFMRTLTHAYPPMIINDAGVRLRAFPGLTGDIIRILNNGESVNMLAASGLTYIPGFSIDVNDEFHWIYVETRTGRGWVYGEFLSLAEGIVPYKINSIDATRLSTAKGIIEPGMKKEDLIALLGAPVSVDIDTERKEEVLKFNLDGELTITISQYTNRIDHIIVHTPGPELINHIRVGMPLQDVVHVNGPSNRGGFYTTLNYFKISEFDCTVILAANAAGIITQIQLAGYGER
jgi:hypothetical protein